MRSLEVKTFLQEISEHIVSRLPCGLAAQCRIFKAAIAIFFNERKYPVAAAASLRFVDFR